MARGGGYMAEKDWHRECPGRALPPLVSSPHSLDPLLFPQWLLRNNPDRALANNGEIGEIECPRGQGRGSLPVTHPPPC